MALFGLTSKEDLTGRRVCFNNYSSLLLIVGFTLTNAAVFPCDLPSAEIVSIYNNQYNIPQGFGPYFIKINRCIDAGMQCPQFTMPNTTKLVKIVVQSNTNGKVYEYTLHDHISCMCGPQNKRDLKLYESSRKRVSVAYKQKYEKNNPPYIVDCSQPQQRYQKIKDFHHPLFLGYKQCLPRSMCITGNTVTREESITHWSGHVRKVNVTNDVACSYPTYSVSNENNSHDNIFNIDSKKTFFALVLLALVFLIAIIIDLTFCCRKKGFCYSLRKCVQGEEETPQGAIQPTLV
ncbi:Hypothetical predicted protein [Paramuricea clavata]|uniref:Uncharacterized protein n=1 Tax=Paramuricea clavata TaxID=317549 RepID=A0A6S7IFY5_PARCT|nr:Hypothetical predicted protein [Paramuricea clavata]